MYVKVLVCSVLDLISALVQYSKFTRPVVSCPHLLDLSIRDLVDVYARNQTPAETLIEEPGNTNLGSRLG